MESQDSFIRSAARATSSAFSSLPIRWRLAGGSAVLTLVILCGFAMIVGVLTTRRIQSDFDRQVQTAADDLSKRISVQLNPIAGEIEYPSGNPDLTDYAAGKDAAIRLIIESGHLIRGSHSAPYLGQPLSTRSNYGGYLVETRQVPINGWANHYAYLQYGRRLSDVHATTRRVKLFLGLGVLGGTGLALLAGLATARRAMSPIAELTEAARRIERTRDPSLRLPPVEAEDEVAELSRTLESMLRSLGAARGETEAALKRQRQFVADASHELRTPLTSVLANLELLVEELEGDQRDTASSALRSSRRMRRLVADLLLLARADAGRHVPAKPLDLARIVADAAAELEPLTGEGHTLSLALEPARVDGVRDELHRLALNLMENAIDHTPAGTTIQVVVRQAGDETELVVEDDGPGIPAELADRVFDRFVRGDDDRGSSTGLGLAIVRAVAESHGGTARLETPMTGRGARFVIRLPGLPPEVSELEDRRPATARRA